ncbi:MAG: hypothetical protein IAE87_03665, partial [Rhodobacteraceae bacterium]|nr:hypothetical protein [Paracoccaceae bacterium]
MSILSTSTFLAPALRDLNADIEAGLYDLAGAFAADLDHFFGTVLPAQRPEVIRLSSSRIELRSLDEGDDYRIVLTGSGIGPVGSLAQLEQAIGNGLATGTISRIAASMNGTEILSLALGAGGYTLISGEDEIAVAGHLPDSLQAITRLADLVGSFDMAALQAMSDPQRAQYFADLGAFEISAITVSSQGDTLLSFTLGATAASLTIGGLTLTVAGTLPDDFGAMAQAAYQIFLQTETGDGNPDLAAIAGLGIDSIRITDSSGAVLANLTGPITDGSLSANTLTGTEEDDTAAYSDVAVVDASEVTVALLGGDDLFFIDIAELAHDMASDPGEVLRRIDGGTGANRLFLDNPTAGAVADIDLASGILRVLGGDAAAGQIGEVAISGFRQVVLSGAGIAVNGGATGEAVIVSHGFTGQDIQFSGGEGQDLLDLSMTTGLAWMAGWAGLRAISTADLASYSFTAEGSSGMIRGLSTAGQPTLHLDGVEVLRVLSAGNPGVTADLQVATVAAAATTIALAAPGTASGTFLSDRITGSAGRDALYGHGGHDLLVGNAGGDTLSGGDGADTLNGGTGDDFLFGG